MRKTDVLIGFLIGIAATIIGAYFFLKLKTAYDLFDDFYTLKNEHILGKVIVLGALLNIIVFFILLQKKKELMARGVVLATIILAITTMFI